MRRWKLTAGRLAYAIGYVYYPSVETDAKLVESKNKPTHDDEVRSISDRLASLNADTLREIQVKVMMENTPTHFDWRILNLHSRLRIRKEGSTVQRVCHITLGTSNVRCLYPTVRPV